MDPLIKDRVQKAFTNNRGTVFEMLAAAKREPNEPEAVIYAAYQELLAMMLAGADEQVRYCYVEAACRFVDKEEPGQGERLEQRFLEYSSAFGLDVADGQAHLAPKMIGLALDNIVGASDESVVSARMALVMVHKSCLEVKVPFFKDLKIVI
ncbi:hypothetical protein [Thioalkalivibrio sp. ALE11]|uniref:hypothetical protein n=1 Tax=Thioalkalivibrio sp. ALE11 TaxID=1265494 RepID=UPI0012DCA6BA|nr:hypothetical protein [Thioalkalivibrio sp. ALE11]